MEWTREGCEQAAIDSHERAIGNVRTSRSIEIDFGDSVGVRRYVSKEPVSVRVLRTPPDTMLTWNGDFLDARWQVELLQELEAVGDDAQALWIYDPTSWELGRGPDDG